ncbi:MAG: hypothetical protein KDG55_02185 [Rhodocyclaceae bacterium]|nr:hypothetical protein [Rhodocyclaceae bacterium]
MPASTHFLQVRIDGDWHCVVVDRDRRVEVEQMLIRDAVVASGSDCPDCAAQLEALAAEAAAAAPPPPPQARSAPADDSAAPASAGTVQAAAMAIQGQRLVVVLVPLALVESPGEAEMATERLAATFQGAPIVLMGQRDDGSPHYAGDPLLCGLLEGIPLERMPWKVFRLR